MKILITNDDGIRAPGLRVLADWAAALGEVVVCAPSCQQSGKSHAITIGQPFRILPSDAVPGAEAYEIDGTPVDCVRYALIGLGRRFDLVLSGVNRGYNAGDDIVFSGTVGAAMEAARMEQNAIALSASPADTPENFARQLPKVYDFLISRKLFDRCRLFNVNIPPEPRGILWTRQGGTCYTDEFVPKGDGLYAQEGECRYLKTDDPSLDTGALAAGYVSITPLTLTRTDFAVYDSFRSAEKL